MPVLFMYCIHNAQYHAGLCNIMFVKLTIRIWISIAKEIVLQYA